MNNPGLKDVEKYLTSHGKKAAMTLSIMSRLNFFIQAMNSTIGQELLSDDIARHEELLIKIYEEDATDQEKAEFRYLKKRLRTISGRIAEYAKHVDEVSGTVKKATSQRS